MSAFLLGGLAVTHDAWDAFWDSVPHNQRLLLEDAKEYLKNLAALIPLTPDLRVLDFGCGWGNVARLLSPRIGELYLWDESPRMRHLAAGAVAGLENARLIELGGHNDHSNLPAFDLIIANSVAQFMTAEELVYWLRRWRHMLAPKGHIVVSDLVPPEYPAGADLITLLRFSASRGFLLRALYDAARVMPLYQRTRRARPFLRTSHDQLTRWGSDAALAVRGFPRNLTCFRKRITVVYGHARQPG